MEMIGLFIRLFIRTTSHDKAYETAQNVVSNISNEMITETNYKIEPYWKFDDSMVVEIRLEISREFDDKEKMNFLNSIADKWTFWGPDNSEALSSETMEDCRMKYDLEMINIFFKDY